MKMVLKLFKQQKQHTNRDINIHLPISIFDSILLAEALKNVHSHILQGLKYVRKKTECSLSAA